MSIKLSDYRALVSLDEAFAAQPADDESEANRLVHELADAMLAMAPSLDPGNQIGPARPLPARQGLAALLTARPPRPYLSSELHHKLDRLLSFERQRRDTQAVTTLPAVSEAFPASAYPAADTCALWQGDITTLEVDAIVNAANDALLGCFHPFHACIDNAIHAVAGPWLREDCDRIMRLQGHPEVTGTAKVTRAYHLPSRFVLHTVGPIHRGTSPVPSWRDREALASCYRACLALTAEVGGIRSVAFCCISTGVFGFPAGPAAEVALGTVADWLRANPGKLDRVVFNVFSEQDLNLYQALLTGESIGRT